jgi:DNA polymerase-3 subunit epsilon
MRQIVLDTETTGLSTADGHRIIEIGCVELSNRQYTSNTFHRYIHPQRDIDQGALAVHGITTQFLADKPKFQEIIEELIAFINGAELIIHNAPFDTSFLNYEFKLAGAKFKSLQNYCTVFDTLQLARKKHPGQQNNLDALCKRYEIDNTKREMHGALLDAHLLAQVYLAMTGGQTSFFGENQPANKPEAKVQPVKTPKQRKLKVIFANESERQAHQGYVAFMKSSSGKASLYEKNEETSDVPL